MMYIDKCAYTNKLVNVHPLEKLIFAICTMLVCLTAKSMIIPVITVILMAVISVFAARIPIKFYAKLMLIPLSFIILGVLSIAINIINNADTVLWSISIYGKQIGITGQSLDYSVRLLLKSFGTVSCLYFLSLTTPLIDIISILRKLKFPEIFLELMSLIYRLIFIFVRIAGKIHTSQASRLGYSSLKNQYRSLGQLISCLFIRSYKNVNDLFTSLESRCYTGKLNVLEKQYKYAVSNFILIIIIEISLIFVEIISKT